MPETMYRSRFSDLIDAVGGRQCPLRLFKLTQGISYSYFFQVFGIES